MRPDSNSVEFSFKPSRRFRLAITALHGVAMLLVVAGPFPTWMLALLPLIALSGWLNWRIPDVPVQLRSSGNEWFLITSSDAGSESFSWLPSTRIGPRLTLLHGKSGARRCFWAVAGDSLPADEFRRLRVWVGLASRVSPRPRSD